MKCIPSILFVILTLWDPQLASAQNKLPHGIFPSKSNPENKLRRLQRQNSRLNQQNKMLKARIILSDREDLVDEIAVLKASQQNLRIEKRKLEKQLNTPGLTRRLMTFIFMVFVAFAVIQFSLHLKKPQPVKVPASKARP